MKCARAGCEKRLNQAQVRAGNAHCSRACYIADRNGFAPKVVSVSGYNMACAVCGTTHDARVAIEKGIEIGICGEQCAIRYALQRREEQHREVELWRKPAGAR